MAMDACFFLSTEVVYAYQGYCVAMNVSFVLVLGPAGGRWWLALSGGVEKFPPVFVHILDQFLGGAKGGGQPPCLFLPLLVFCRCVGCFLCKRGVGIRLI